MKYLSLDLETTCLQPHPDHILQISMVVEDTAALASVEELPHFTCFIKQEPITGEAYALAMNSWILEILSGRGSSPHQTLLPTNWEINAQKFLDRYFGGKKITVAGKNVAGFDLPFLPAIFRRNFRHKVLDPGTLFVDWKIDDQVPNFDICKKRAGIDGEVKHDALEDARDVIRLLRKGYA